MLTLRPNFLIKIAIITVKKIISNKIEITLLVLINIGILYSILNPLSQNKFGIVLMGYILVFAISSSGMIKEEFQNKTLISFIVSPLSKEELFLGKFLGPSVLILLIMLFNFIIFSAGQLIYGRTDFLELNLKLILYVYLIGLYLFSLGMLLSTFLKGNKNFIVLVVLYFMSFFIVTKMGLNFMHRMETYALLPKEKILLFILSLGNPVFFKFINEKYSTHITLSLIAIYIIISLYFMRKISLGNSR